MKHRSGWWQGIIGNPSRPGLFHWFDNDEGVSVCGSMPWRKPMAQKIIIPTPELCKKCARMVDACP